MQDVAELTAFAGGILILAALLSLPVLVTTSALTRLRSRHGEATFRRCDRCARGWEAVGDRDLTLGGVLVRRSVRRLARSRGRTAPRWSRAQGWSRCPSCLSRRVRAAEDPTTAPPGRWSAARIASVVAAGCGILLIAAAVLGAS